MDVEMNVYVCGYVYVYGYVNVYKHSEEVPLQTDSDAFRTSPGANAANRIRLVKSRIDIKA